MDLRGLENIQWRGFSDREIRHLHQHHGSIKNNMKVDVKMLRTQQKVEAKEDKTIKNEGDTHYDCDTRISKELLDPETLQSQNKVENKETSSDTILDDSLSEFDLEKQYVSNINYRKQRTYCGVVKYKYILKPKYRADD